MEYCDLDTFSIWQDIGPNVAPIDFAACIDSHANPDTLPATRGNAVGLDRVDLPAGEPCRVDGIIDITG